MRRNFYSTKFITLQSVSIGSGNTYTNDGLTTYGEAIKGANWAGSATFNMVNYLDATNLSGIDISTIFH
jgi:hypothetical protein